MILRKNLVFRAISLVLVVSLTTWLTSNPIKLVYAKDTDSQTSQVSAQQKETRGPCEGDTPDAESVPVSTDNNFDQTLVKEFSGVTIKHVAHMPPELTDKNEARSNFISSSIQTPNNISETFPKSHQYTTEPEAVRLKLVNTSDAKDHGTEELDHFPIKNQEGLYSVEFCEESGRGLVKFTHKESSLNLEPFGVDVSKGRSNTNTILYPNIYESVDLKYTLEDYRLKEELILNKPADTNEFTFRLEITDLEIERRWDRIVFLNNETKEPVFYMPKPYALDDEGRTCDSISWNLSDNGVLKITLDSEWLKNATYPVVIDPSITLSGVEIHQASQEFGTIQG